MLRVFVPKERLLGETRVAATPETVRRMVQDGLEVVVEAGAGASAFFTDAHYAEAGAQVQANPAALWASADIVLKVRPPTMVGVEGMAKYEAEQLQPGAVLIGLLAPQQHPEMVQRLAAGRVTALALELLPRTSRAQPMDALSSQASIAGYKAVILAASHLGRYFPLLMTAAGTVPPARVLVLGAGVAGLQAVATARRLGAVVDAFDIREAVKAEVESLGARFVGLPPGFDGEGQGGYARSVGPEVLRQQHMVLQEHVAGADVVITTAQVPGKRAPTLITADMVKAMRSGSVIVDLAVGQGGNCELSVCGQDVSRHGVFIVGHPNLPATVPIDASSLYARNVLALLRHVVREGRLHLDLTDDITREVLLTHQGEVRHGAIAALIQRGAA